MRWASPRCCAIFGEFQHLRGSVGVKRHCVDVLPARASQRGRCAHAADPHFGIMKEYRQRFDLSCECARVPIAGLIGDAGKAHRHREPGRLPVHGPQGRRKAFLVCRQCRRLGFLGSRADSLRRRLHRRSRPRFVQPRGTRDCCERHNNAGQQQRPPAGHANRLNGASSTYCCGSVSLGFRGGQPVRRRNSCAHSWVAVDRESGAIG
jgi:hypothetical protein